MTSTIQIRKVTPYEVAALRPLAVAFGKEANLPGGINPDVWEDSWMNWLGMEMGIVLAAYDDSAPDVPLGTIGVLKFNCPNNGDSASSEMFWYVNEEHRSGSLGVQLFNAMESILDDHGVKRRTMIRLENESGERVHGFYLKQGYRPLERHYVKEGA